MADKTKPTDWRVLVWAGYADIAVGAAFIVAGLLGFLGEDGVIFAAVGVVLALAGAGIAFWARNKMSQGPDLGGDRN